MTDHERAEWLARAVDRMLHGITQDDATNAYDEETSELLEIARLRRDVGESAREMAREHEESVWKDLMARVRGRETGARGGAVPKGSAEEGVSLLRRPRGPDASLTPREAGWTHTMLRDAERKAAASQGNVYPETGDPKFDSLVRAALASSHPSETGGTRSQSPQPAGAPVLTVISPRVLVAATGAALFLSAVGPMPLQGFAEPPTKAITYLRQHPGVVEVSSQPTLKNTGEPVSGINLGPGEASLLLGIPISAGRALPGGFTLVSSRYFAESIAAEKGGVHALCYSDGGASTLMVYQESNSAASLVAWIGSTVDTSVAGHDATYFEGQWTNIDGAVAWKAAHGQTVTFAASGARFIVAHAGPQIERAALLAVAEAIAAG